MEITPETRLTADGSRPENLQEYVDRLVEEEKQGSQVEPYDVIWCVQLVGFSKRDDEESYLRAPGYREETIEWFRRQGDAVWTAEQADARVSRNIEHWSHILVWRYERETDWAPILERQVL